MRYLVTVAALALGACAVPVGGGGAEHLGPPAEAGQQIEGSWHAFEIGGVPAIPGSTFLLRLQGGSATGHSGCNGFGGDYEPLVGGGIRFGPLAMTRMACQSDALNEQERRGGEILSRVEQYSLGSDGSLILIAGDGRTIRFRRG